jgi:hypothetical protein
VFVSHSASRTTGRKKGRSEGRLGLTPHLRGDAGGLLVLHITADVVIYVVLFLSPSNSTYTSSSGARPPASPFSPSPPP